MRHIRLFNHYINAEYIPLALLEFGLLMGAVWAAVQIQFRNDPAQLAIQLTGSLPSFVAFAVVLSLMGFAMRVYPARFREGHTGMALRTLVAFFLLGGIALTVLGTLFAQFYLPQGVLLYALPLAIWRFPRSDSFSLHWPMTPSWRAASSCWGRGSVHASCWSGWVGRCIALACRSWASCPAQETTSCFRRRRSSALRQTSSPPRTKPVPPKSWWQPTSVAVPRAAITRSRNCWTASWRASRSPMA
ncbi:MAG: hypothetical protein ACKO4A_13735 [Gammaproteobacteria bacterium]